MTANEDVERTDSNRRWMPDTSPTPVDGLTKRHEALTKVCAMFCHAHRDDHHWVCATIQAELRSRASIGPDSERIRELEAEVERLWQRLKANAVTIGRYRRKEMIDSGVMESQPHPEETL
jgi:hypothetical protein